MPGVTGGGPPWQFAVVTTISADLGNTCVFPSLASGGCLHVVSTRGDRGRRVRRLPPITPLTFPRSCPRTLSALLDPLVRAASARAAT